MKTYADLYRIRNNASQEDAARIIGRSRQTYAEREAGRQPFDMEDVDALCAGWKDENGQPLTAAKFKYGPAGEPPDRETTQFFNKGGA